MEKFASGSVRLGSGWRPELALLAVIVAVVAAVYFYRRAPGGIGRGKRAVLSALRGLALALVVLILFRPVLSIPLPLTHNCFVAVLVDDSRSMRIEDAGAQGARTAKAARKSRLSVVKDVLSQPAKANPDGEGALLEELKGVATVRLFKFSGRAERIGGIDEVIGTGERTNLYDALRVLDTELRGVPLVAGVMLSDGADNSAGSPAEMAAELGRKNIPIYCVGVGDPNPPNDYEVMRVYCPREVRCNTSVEIQASIRATGFDKPFQVILTRGERVLETVNVVPDPDVDIHPVRLTFRPDDQGTFRYAVEIPSAPGELIEDNNRYEFLVKVTDKRLPVLYLEGSPREEYRFLRRALFRDKDFRIASILRTEGPKKYILQGAEPEDGLKEAPGPGARGPRDKDINGYPETKKHLYRFEAVILGDIEATYLTRKQREITEAFVRERGGGLLMLGGVNSFNLGNYQDTMIEKMLPVILPRPNVAYQHREFSIALTKIGEKHPVMRQTGNRPVDRSLWSQAPTLVGYNPIREVKLGAEVLATEPKSGNPVLVVQNYGSGRVAAFATGGSWHWQMAVPVTDELHEKFWKQLVRWLAVGSKGNISVRLDRDVFAANEPVSIRTKVLDNELNPIDNAKVTEVVAIITDPFGNKHKLPQEWVLSDEGVYQAQYKPADVGDYQVEVIASLTEGPKLSQTTSFSVGETLTEFRDAGQKRALLKDIAGKSGGKYVTAEEARHVCGEVKKLIAKMKMDETIRETRDIWDTPLLFGLLALALSAEWLLRRRAGLM